MQDTSCILINSECYRFDVENKDERDYEKIYIGNEGVSSKNFKNKRIIMK